MPAQLRLVTDNSAFGQRGPASGTEAAFQAAEHCADREGEAQGAIGFEFDSEPDEAARPWSRAAWVPPPPRLGRRARFRRSFRFPRARPASDSIPPEDRGAVTAEYAIVIMAAVAFAGLLVAIMRSNEVRQMLVDLVQNALGSAG